MTMKWLTILQFLEIVAAYGIVTLFCNWHSPAIVAVIYPC